MLGTLIAGGVVGAIVGLLLAPRSGSELRADISRRSGTLTAKARSMASTTQVQIGPAIGALRQGVGPATERVRGRVAPVIEQMATRLGRSRDGYETNGRHEHDAATPEESGASERQGE
jgi:gas vesicle protein